MVGAVQAFANAVEKGDVGAMMILARVLWEGVGLERVVQRAMGLCECAVEIGGTDAMYNLALIW